MSSSSNTVLEMDGMEVPIACSFSNFCVVGLLRNQARYSGKTVLLVSLITKKDVEATEVGL